MKNYIHSNTIRAKFAQAMSLMYRQEVPQYGDLIELVEDVNQWTLDTDPTLKSQLESSGELQRLNVERHGAIRVGTAEELSNLRRLFAVMGMYPVSYYDLSIAGIPVHSTAFRPVDIDALAESPFRIFTSLLRLELIEDKHLANTAAEILSQRQIITDKAFELIETAERNNCLTETESNDFIKEALETFRWHSESTVSKETYEKLKQAHTLIADVISFKGPHINHLTPRTLDIDIVQKRMPEYGMTTKDIVEGPPRRMTDILLRQTSFKALTEEVVFIGNEVEKTNEPGNHTARFGEIEQRGIALTKKGRTLYDNTLAKVRQIAANSEKSYSSILEEEFEIFPDDYAKLRQQGLAFFKYHPNNPSTKTKPASDIESLIKNGDLAYSPQTYEDFLPISAAGIFQSNLNNNTKANAKSKAKSNYSQTANQAEFEQALGAKVINEMDLYAQIEKDSLNEALLKLGQTHLI
jgi:uncharacterized glyoxalase superfamily metalloenzyme YdcJ